MERKVQPKEISINISNISTMDIVARLPEWSAYGGAEDGIKQRFDFVRRAEDGTIWSFRLEKMKVLGRVGTASLINNEGEMKAMLAGITGASLNQDGISFISGDSRYIISERGLRHHLAFSPRAIATIDIPK